MKINNPVTEYKKRNPKWVKMDHFDDKCYIITRYQNINKEYSEFGFMMGFRNGSRFSSGTIEILERRQPRTPAYPSSRTDVFKNRKLLKQLFKSNIS